LLLLAAKTHHPNGGGQAMGERLLFYVDLLTEAMLSIDGIC
jgi:hypothetical protein